MPAQRVPTGKKTGASGAESGAGTTPLRAGTDGAAAATKAGSGTDVADGGDPRGDLSCFKEVLEALYQMILRRPLPTPRRVSAKDLSGDDDDEEDEQDKVDIEEVLTLGGIDFVLPQILHIYSLLLPVTLVPDVQQFSSSKSTSSSSSSSSSSPSSSSSTTPTGSSSELPKAGNSSTRGASSRIFLSGAVEKVIRLELLRDFVLAVCEKSLPIALKVVWTLLGEYKYFVSKTILPNSHLFAAIG